MDQKTADLALKFLQRVSLVGSEVPAFLAVTGAIADIARGAVECAPAKPFSKAINDV
jgi:hypothetical protein